MGELEIFSTRIKELRDAIGMTQKEFSEHIGVKQQTLSGYERGIMKPPLDVAKNIAEKCEVSIDWLCGLSEKMNYNNSLSTYADVIDLLVKAESALGFDVDEGTENVIIIHDSVIECFLKDWAKMLSLHNSGIIDKNLYSLWLSNQKNIYATVHLHNTDDVEEFLSDKIVDKYIE